MGYHLGKNTAGIKKALCIQQRAKIRGTTFIKTAFLRKQTHLFIL